MLVLSRHKHERLLLTVPGKLMKDGQPLEIDIVVCDIRSDKVRIGTEAPQEVHIIRKELVEC